MQTSEIIKNIYDKTFNKRSSNIKIEKLSGGLKNHVYLINDNENKMVLKIAPTDENKMITVDRNILWWEKEMLELMKKINIPAPELIKYNDEKEIHPSPYIFMSYIEGINYQKEKAKLSHKDQEKIEFEMGRLSSEICKIKSNSFFLPHDKNKNFQNNYDFVNYLFDKLLDNAKESNVKLGKDYDKVRNLILQKKDFLNNISSICLTHTDIWNGNVLINNKKLVGIIDFADLYFCDYLMTFYFHPIDSETSKDFLKGFNKQTLTKDENIRIEIYKMYTILKMIVDCKLKEYGKFPWMYEKFDSIYKRVRKL